MPEQEITDRMIVHALERAFESAEGSSALEGLDALKIEHYRTMKQAILSGEMIFDQAVAAAVAYHTRINENIPPSSTASAAEQDPYCYPGTDVLINKLGIRDKLALQIAETEITTLRMAQLSFRMPRTAPPSTGGYASGKTDSQIQKMLDALNSFTPQDE